MYCCGECEKKKQKKKKKKTFYTYLEHRHLTHGECFSLTVSVFGAIKLAINLVNSGQSYFIYFVYYIEDLGINLCRNLVISGQGHFIYFV